MFKEGLEGYLSFLRNRLRLSPPVKVKVGVSGVEGFSINDPRFEDTNTAGRCTQNEVIYEVTLSTFEVDVEEVLSPFFQKLWEEFTLPGNWKAEDHQA